jgi:hypothetical protein
MCSKAYSIWKFEPTFALKINYLYCLELGVCDGKKRVLDCMKFICELNCRSQNMEAVYRVMMRVCKRGKKIGARVKRHTALAPSPVKRVAAPT